MKNFKEYVDEGKKITIDVDYSWGEDSATMKEFDRMNKRFKVKVKETGNTSADVTGTKEDLIKWLDAAGYDDLEELYPILFSK